jgi:hypothetical protein
MPHRSAFGKNNIGQKLQILAELSRGVFFGQRLSAEIPQTVSKSMNVRTHPGQAEWLWATRSFFAVAQAGRIGRNAGGVMQQSLCSETQSSLAAVVGTIARLLVFVVGLDAGPALAELRFTTSYCQNENRGTTPAKQRAFDRDEKLSLVKLSLLRAYRK